MIKVTREMALRYHETPAPGKIEVIPTKPYSSQLDLSLAYSPGVAFPCLEIKDNPADIYRYTDKGNLVGVVSNGTAVLGLGDIGPLAGKPVMEGKALLFKIFAGLDAFDIEVDEKDPQKLISIVKAISPTFGGINLEDIKAPECFVIEDTLKKECDIPVMHDDQHGTAIISAAGLLNALDLQHKEIGDIRLVVNGAGAAAIACTKLYVRLGVKPENVVMCDSKGVIRADRPNLPEQKALFATTRDLHTLADALAGADVFLGLSVKGVLTPRMLLSMAPRPIVFALANPDPEIDFETAVKTRDDLIFATGRSDYPNQINNVLGFPYIFRGALDCRATCINEEMKIGAVKAIADLARRPVPPVVDAAYGESHLSFGREYILPKALDPRLLAAVAPAVAKAAAESGVARRPIHNLAKYAIELDTVGSGGGRIMRRIVDLAKRSLQRVVLSGGEAEKMIAAAARLAGDGICVPVLLGQPEHILKTASLIGADLTGCEIIDPRSDEEKHRTEQYAALLASLMQRKGMTRDEALYALTDDNCYAMAMVRHGDADACIASTYASADRLAEQAESIIGLADGIEHMSTLSIMGTRMGTYYISDVAIAGRADARGLADTARMAACAVRFLGEEPVVAMLSYSSFGSGFHTGDGSAVAGTPECVARAVELLHNEEPDLAVDGEMQLNYALDTAARDRLFPFNRLKGREVNTLIFPGLNSANITAKMMLSMGMASMVGPIQLGLRLPVHFIHAQSEVTDIVNLAAVAAVDASVLRHEGMRLTPARH